MPFYFPFGLSRNPQNALRNTITGGAFAALTIIAVSGAPALLVTNSEDERLVEISGGGHILVGTGATPSGTSGQCLQSGGGSGEMMSWGACGGGGGGGSGNAGTGNALSLGAYEADNTITGSLIRITPGLESIYGATTIQATTITGTTLSGSSLHADTTLSSSGNLLVEDTGNFGGLVTANDFECTDCLVADDIATAAIGFLEIAANAVAESELDEAMNFTATGDWNFNGTNTFNSMSGGALYATTMSGSGLASCSGATNAITWNSTTELFGCNTITDNDTTYTAGQGLSLAGTTFSVNASLTGTNLTYTGTISGAHLYAASAFSGAGLVSDCDANNRDRLQWDVTTERFSCDTDTLGTADITDGSIIEPDIDADNSPSDGDVLTYDSTGTNFAWITPNAGTDITADLEEEVTEGSLADDVILEADLKVVDSPADEECLTYEATGGDFEWQSCGGGSSEWTDGGDFLHPADSSGSEDVIIGSNAEASARIKLGSGGTISGASLTIGGITQNNGTAALQGVTVALTLSVTGRATFDDDIFVLGTMSGNHLFAGTMSGAGLSDCDTNNRDRVQWDATNEIFSCDSDTFGTADVAGLDVSDDLNLTCGTDCTLTGDEISVDDAFLANHESDTMIGTLTADGLTLGANENITLGAQTLDHDGTNFVFNDSVSISNLVTNGGVVYSDGTALQDTDSGSSGMVLTLNGTTPEWSTGALRTAFGLANIGLNGSGVASGTGQTSPIPMPFGFHIEDIELDINLPPGGQALQVNLQEDGTSMLSTAAEIDAGAKQEDGNHVFSDRNLDAGDRLVINIVQVGTDAAGHGTGLTILIRGYKYP